MRFSSRFPLLVVLSISITSVFAASEFLPYATELATSGIISTQSSESGYRLGDNLSRAESAKLVVNAIGIDRTICTGDVYGDVSEQQGDLCSYIETARAHELISSATRYRPADPVTRAEFTKFVVNAAKLQINTSSAGFGDVSASNTLASYINTLAAAGVINKTSRFRPNDNITRGEAFKMLVGALRLRTDNTSTTDSTAGSTVSGEASN